MNIKLVKEHIGNPDDFIHPCYNYMFWDVEFECDETNTAEFQTELARTDIWTDGEPQSPVRYRYTGGSDVLTKIQYSPLQFKNDLLTTAYNAAPHIFRDRWPRDLDYYLEKTNMASTIYKDLPGIDTKWHLDNNHIILQLIINLEDNNTGTEFYTINSREPFYLSSSKKNTGVMFFNNAGALHNIRNITRDRYILYTAITYEK